MDRGTRSMMTGASLDPRTAAHAVLLRAACTLPIARVHGSLVGRPGVSGRRARS